jgi:hypothetical protein
MVKGGRHVVRQSGFAPQFFSKMITLFISVKKGQQLGGHAVFSRVTGKLDNGQKRGSVSDAGGGSDRIAENERDTDTVDDIPNAAPQIGSGPLGGGTPKSTVL